MSKLHELTQEEFYYSIGQYISDRMEDAIFWQRCAADWYQMIVDYSDVGTFAAEEKIIRFQKYAAEDHKLARLYAGTWE